MKTGKRANKSTDCIETKFTFLMQPKNVVHINLCFAIQSLCLLWLSFGLPGSYLNDMRRIAIRTLFDSLSRLFVGLSLSIFNDMWNNGIGIIATQIVTLFKKQLRDYAIQIHTHTHGCVYVLINKSAEAIWNCGTDDRCLICNWRNHIPWWLSSTESNRMVYSWELITPHKICCFVSICYSLLLANSLYVYLYLYAPYGLSSRCAIKSNTLS